MRVFYFFLFIIYSCNGREDSVGLVSKNIPLINIDNSLAHSSLENIVDSLRFISLQTNKDNSIKTISKILFINNSIYILDKKFSSVHKFSLSGQYEGAIGSMGSKYGQYKKITDLLYQPYKKTLWILCNSPNAIIEYSLSGEFIQQEDLPDFPSSIGIKSQNLYYYFSNHGVNGKNKNHNLLLTDSNNNVIESYFKPPSNIEVGINFTGGIYSTDFGIFFNPPLTNSFYLLNNEKKVNKFMTVSFGQNNLPSGFKSTEDLFKNINNYAYLGKSLVFNEQYIGFNYINKNGHKSQTFFDRNSKNIATSDTNNPLSRLFKNEIYSFNKTIVSPIPRTGLKKWASKNEKALKNRFPALYDEIENKNENYNPILLFYKIKNF